MLTLFRFEISRSFALANARVIMINRKEEQGQEAIDKIKTESKGQAKVEWIECDLGNLAQVKEVFNGIRERESRLDLVSSPLSHHLSIKDLPD